MLFKNIYFYKIFENIKIFTPNLKDKILDLKKKKF